VSVVTATIRNGVDTDKLFATLDLIRAQPELAKFQFRATNRWIEGAHNRSTIKGFYAAGVDDEPRNGFERIGVLFRVTGNAPDEKLREIVERAKARSAVYDMVTNGVPVAVEVTTD
jgi:hypothetical protein